MRYRTFIAIDVSKFSRDRLHGIQNQLAPIADGVKWMSTDNLHLTLVFMGVVHEREVVRVCQAVQAVAAQVASFTFSLAGLGAFPNTRRPRTLIANVADGKESLLQLHALLEPALQELGCYRREERPFTPHVTLGRVLRDAGENLPEYIHRFSGWQGGETPVREIRVMASQLNPSGREYVVLGRGKLLGGSGARPVPS